MAVISTTNSSRPVESSVCKSIKGQVVAKSDVSVIDMAGAAAVTSKASGGEEDHDLELTADYSQRGQWLRAALLGANDGLVSTASLMMGVGAVKADAKAMLLSGLSGLVAGACSMAIGEFVSVYSQLDVELSQIKRENNKELEAEKKKKKLPNPIQAASASAMAFTVGALVPLLSAAFIKSHWVRMGVLVAASSVALVGFGAVGAYVGKSPGLVRASARVLLGGWAAMLITYGMLRLFGSVGI
jgi:VIT1/CCC1 family predicted Fe2+/Mn2+ transporter